MLSDETYRRMKEIDERLNDIMGKKKCTREEAWHYLTANGAYKACETAAKIKARQDQIAIAEQRANSAYNSTLTANLKYTE
jgi:hypothetical protein